jgi:hypothetical protein
MVSSRVVHAFLALTSLLAAVPACSSGDEPASQSSSTTSTDSVSGTGGTGGTGGADGTGGAGGAGGAGGTGSTSTGTGTGGGPPTSMYCAPDTVDTTPQGASAFTVRTAHYQLYAEASKDDAEEMARMLEAAYPAFEAYFAATPPLAANERLAVKFFADEPSWAAGLMADGIMVPSEAGGYYAPSTKTAYLYKQGNPYYTHVLLLHEATHQFHLLARTKGQKLPFWYVEGVAESLGRHDWDGHCVALGVVPLLSWEDIPADALPEVTSAGFDLASIVDGSATASRAVSWSIYEFLDHGKGGAHHEAFKAYRDAVDANQPNPSFATLVGDPAALSPPLALHLVTAQEPMQPIYTEWTHTGQHATFGDSLLYFSFAVTKSSPAHFEARYDVPSTPSWSAGVMLGYQDNKNYLALVLSQNGKLQLFRSTAGSLIFSAAGTAPASLGDGTGTLAIDYGPGATVTATVNGTTSSHAVTLPLRGGIALYDSQVRFHDIAWK